MHAAVWHITIHFLQYGHYYTSFILIVLRTRAALMSHLAVVVAQVVFIIVFFYILSLLYVYHCKQLLQY